MKAICLASAMTIVLLLSVTIAFRFDPRKHRVRQGTTLYLACLVVLIAVWATTPDDLGFLPPWVLATPSWFDLMLSLFFFTAAFFGGVLQLYNLADRGFSLRILIDAFEQPSGAVGAEQLLAGYGGGQGVKWMYDKRIHGLLEGDLVRRMEDRFVLTPQGIGVADMFIHIRRFLKLDRS